MMSSLTAVTTPRMYFIPRTSSIAASWIQATMILCAWLFPVLPPWPSVANLFNFSPAESVTLLKYIRCVTPPWWLPRVKAEVLTNAYEAPDDLVSSPAPLPFSLHLLQLSPPPSLLQPRSSRCYSHAPIKGHSCMVCPWLRSGFCSTTTLS